MGIAKEQIDLRLFQPELETTISWLKQMSLIVIYPLYLNQNIDTVFTSSGHYATLAGRTEYLLDQFDKINELINELHQNNMIKKELQTNFTISLIEKLNKLWKLPNIWYRELNWETDTVKRICDMCLKYNKPKLRPVVRVSLSKDLKETDKICSLHLIDYVTRSCTASGKEQEKRGYCRGNY